MKQLAIGIDIGGTNTVFGLVDRQGAMYGESVLSTKAFTDVDQYVAQLCGQLKELIGQCAEDFTLVGMGVGAPNANYFEGTIENAPNLLWSRGIVVPFVEKIKVHFPDIPIFLTNDANAAALGEMVYGGASQMKDFVVITLGTGLGSGLVSNGKLIYGHDSFAGELGHIIVEPQGRLCGCGREGCLETYVSATGIVRTACELLRERDDESSLRVYSVDNLTSKDIFIEAQRGDKLALEAFDFTARTLGRALANIVVVTSPEAIFLFGGLAKAKDLLFDPTRRYMEDNMMNIFKNKVKILPSSLEDKNAALLGAAALVWSDMDRR